MQHTGSSMKDEIRERWEKLCQQAAVEQDHNKLMELIDEINYLLEAMEKQLVGPRQKMPDNQRAA
jgi:hypothetical protein